MAAIDHQIEMTQLLFDSIIESFFEIFTYTNRVLLRMLDEFYELFERNATKIMKEDEIE